MAFRVLILGTGLIGTSLGLALRALPGFTAEGGRVFGWDPSPSELAEASACGALDVALPRRAAVLEADVADIYVLACPVLAILDWMTVLAPVLKNAQLVTDVGSTKEAICMLARRLYGAAGQAAFLPGHPMAGKESGGAALADAQLFRNAAWLFTPLTPRGEEPALAGAWRNLVEALGAQSRDLEPAEHDELCAWMSHLPQMLSTALAALLQDQFAGDPATMAELQSIGGRALRETTRLGSSPYSMWRDVALTNTDNIATCLLALEQRLAHLRENLRSPELREQFRTANQFRPTRG